MTLTKFGVGQMEKELQQRIELAYRLAKRPARIERAIDQVLDIGTRYILVLKQKIWEFLGDDFSSFQFETNLWRFCVQPFTRRKDQTENVTKRIQALANLVPLFIRNHGLEAKFPLHGALANTRYWEHSEVYCGHVCHRTTCRHNGPHDDCACGTRLGKQQLKIYWKQTRKRRRNRLHGPYT